ncbi:hypothetical protein AKJ16_DCAP24266 [Drosera capensis]
MVDHFGYDIIIAGGIGAWPRQCLFPHYPLFFLTVVDFMEKPRNHLDMRHRLDSKGQRQGKLIDDRHTSSYFHSSIPPTLPFFISLVSYASASYYFTLNSKSIRGFTRTNLPIAPSPVESDGNDQTRVLGQGENDESDENLEFLHLLNLPGPNIALGGPGGAPNPSPHFNHLNQMNCSGPIVELGPNPNLKLGSRGAPSSNLKFVELNYPGPITLGPNPVSSSNPASSSNPVGSTGNHELENQGENETQTEI